MLFEIFGTYGLFHSNSYQSHQVWPIHEQKNQTIIALENTGDQKNWKVNLINYSETCSFRLKKNSRCLKVPVINLITRSNSFCLWSYNWGPGINSGTGGNSLHKVIKRILLSFICQNQKLDQVHFKVAEKLQRIRIWIHYWNEEGLQKCSNRVFVRQTIKIKGQDQAFQQSALPVLELYHKLLWALWQSQIKHRNHKSHLKTWYKRTLKNKQLKSLISLFWTFYLDCLINR